MVAPFRASVAQPMIWPKTAAAMTRTATMAPGAPKRAERKTSSQAIAAPDMEDKGAERNPDRDGDDDDDHDLAGHCERRGGWRGGGLFRHFRSLFS